MQKNLNIEKTAFKTEVLSNAYYQSKITFWYIYDRKFTKYLHGTWSLLNILMIFGSNIDPYNILLANATNIPVLLMTGFVSPGTQIWKFSHLFSHLFILTLFKTCMLSFFLFTKKVELAFIAWEIVFCHKVSHRVILLFLFFYYPVKEMAFATYTI